MNQFLIGQPVTLRGNTGQFFSSFQQQQFGWFIQDDIRVTPTLTLNLGLRHEFGTAYSEKHGRIANLVDWIRDSDVTHGEFRKPHKNNFAPRVGLAWDVFGNGRTAIRAGAGVFYEQLTISSLRSLQSPLYPFRLGFVLPNPGALTASVDNLPAGSGSPASSEPEPSLPARVQWSLNVQQQIDSSTTLSVAYVGSRSNHLQTVSFLNTFVPTIRPDGTKFFPATGARRFNPNWGPLLGYRWAGDGYYNSLQMGLTRRFDSGLQYQASYTWSRNIDTSSNGWSGAISKNGIFGLQDPQDVVRERGLSSNDVRHLFRFNTTYDLPFGANLSGVARQILGGWQVNGLLSLNTGMPFHVTTGFGQARDGQPGGATDRPDLVPGANSNSVEGSTAGCGNIPAGPVGVPTRYFDPCAFELQEPGTYGNLGRNPLIGPGLFNVDLVLTKGFDFSERMNLQFRAEFFNIFNRPNLGDFIRPVFSSPTTRNGSAGRIFNTTTTSRQIQFGLRLSF